MVTQSYRYSGVYVQIINRVALMFLIVENLGYGVFYTDGWEKIAVAELISEA